ncbi:MAG: phosphoribosylformylglycinamidine synthase II, partial [Verrucomicrobiae bacterium]|nr:phosphoribosylformylglycinamidine synthase II [Verrucomicrobiae bacterium]
PQRETGMTPYETMLSESQERMLIIAKKGREDDVRKIFEKWDLHAAEIGFVTSDGLMRVRNRGKVVAEIPAAKLADDAPLYDREAKPHPAAQLRASEFPKADSQEALRQLLASPAIASKRWVYRQYDHQVRLGTAVLPGSDAAVFRIDCGGVEKYLAASADCNGTHCLLNPRQGAHMAVAEAARNLVCSGARPLAVTDNLNFGNPHKPENFWQLRECVEGLAEACRFFNTPVTGGNVSLYNESPEGAVDPTPVVAMVGLVEKKEWITTQWFKNGGDLVYLVGGPGAGLGGSLYAKAVLGIKKGPLPAFSLDEERRVQDVVFTAIRNGWVSSAHDCSEGGLAVALAECCFSGPHAIGLEADLPAAQGSLEEILFNEAGSRVVLSIRPEHQAAFEAIGGAKALTLLGKTGGAELAVKAGGRQARWKLAEIETLWRGSLERLMEEDFS